MRLDWQNLYCRNGYTTKAYLQIATPIKILMPHLADLEESTPQKFHMEPEIAKADVRSRHSRKDRHTWSQAAMIKTAGDQTGRPQQNWQPGNKPAKLQTPGF